MDSNHKQPNPLPITRRHFLGRAAAAAGMPLLPSSIFSNEALGSIIAPSPDSEFIWPLISDALMGSVPINNDIFRNLKDYYSRYPTDANSVAAIVENAKQCKALSLLLRHGISLNDIISKDIPDLPGHEGNEALIAQLKKMLVQTEGLSGKYFSLENCVETGWNVTTNVARAIMSSQQKHPDTIILPEGFDILLNPDIDLVNIEQLQSVLDGAQTIAANARLLNRVKPPRTDKIKINKNTIDAPEGSTQATARIDTSFNFSSQASDIQSQRDILYSFKGHLEQDFNGEVTCGSIRGNKLNVQISDNRYSEAIIQLAQAYGLDDISQEMGRC